MGICLSNQVKAERSFHIGGISSKNACGNGNGLSNPSSKASSASVLSTPKSEEYLSFQKYCNGICLSNKIKAESPFHTGVVSSKYVGGNGTELSNPSSKASSTFISPFPRSEGLEEPVEPDTRHFPGKTAI
ncbi:uncharacterized protein LOC111399726 isoform X3 [Olea europaea var. sylvestris]|uniref:uncharacterized protein LOC111399726 isoform X3 n=1 Tax=Olea europaea var. sylvestris TaxID=158386 RepID=UPI000C1D7B11|nr:uncharacterized protein LOC111399726 isoform X3 [Olea europaea var. sylvestris]